jgi:hypothetical protein
MSDESSRKKLMHMYSFFRSVYVCILVALLTFFLHLFVHLIHLMTMGKFHDGFVGSVYVVLDLNADFV